MVNLWGISRMAALAEENENRQLKDIIIQLRVKLEANHMEMQRRIEKERSDYNQIIIQLQTSIVELRNELENIKHRHLKSWEELKKDKNNEIYQLQETIRELRNILEKANFIDDQTK
ncbi:MAG: hypothetical protein LEGION0403_FIIPPAGN_01906 [Legionella sp.]